MSERTRHVTRLHKQGHEGHATLPGLQGWPALALPLPCRLAPAATPRRLKPLTISDNTDASAVSAKELRNVKYSQALEWVAAAYP